MAGSRTTNDRLSIGLYLGVLVAVAYLAEKYMLAWRRVRWPIPLGLKDFICFALASDTLPFEENGTERLY